MKAADAFEFARAIAVLTASLALCACPARDAANKGDGQGISIVEGPGESKGLDPRSAFESSELIGGITASLESPVALIAPRGVPEAGVALAFGGALSTAAIARRIDFPGAEGFGHELVLASGARASLPGPAIAIAAAGERIVVSCADASSPGRGVLIGYKTEGEGERLVEAWKMEGAPARRLVAVPGGRVAAADEGAGLSLIDASTGSLAWGMSLPEDAADIAYAPGLVLAVAGSLLIALDESTGISPWSAALTARARSLSAGDGVALVLAESGSLSAFSLSDGKGIGAAPGPFDPTLRPIADGSRAIVSQIGGGAAEIEVKSGQTLRTWSWEGITTFIAADKDRLYAGLDGREVRGIVLDARVGEARRRIVELESPAFDSPQAVGGVRGGLLVLLMDGSLVLVGKDREPGEAASALDAAIAPAPETVAAISSALGRFRPAGSSSSGTYLRFDLFAQGMPVDAEVAFTAFRYEGAASAKRTFAARPASGGVVVAIYDSEGRELAASIDELGSSSSAAAFLEKGNVYWIVAGWTFQAASERFRLYLK